MICYLAKGLYFGEIVQGFCTDAKKRGSGDELCFRKVNNLDVVLWWFKKCHAHRFFDNTECGLDLMICSYQIEYSRSYRMSFLRLSYKDYSFCPECSFSLHLS